MIKTFKETVKFLEGFIPTPEKKHPGKLGIERMQYVVELLGNPQYAYPTIHVGGTSGKGSTATLIASILSTRYLVGLHTSPHLVKVNERIVLGSGLKGAKGLTPISDKDFVNLINIIKPAIGEMEKSIYGTPSYFEIVTAMSFLYFKKQKVDIAVIEVGMGGRFDATNVIKPLVAVITNVGLDHTEVLGDTVEKIAEDKAGIVKPGISVVTGVKQSSVMSIIKAKGKRQKAKVSFLGKDFSYKVKAMNKEGSVFDYFGKNTYRNLKLSLLGEHQIENVTLAIRAIELLGSDLQRVKGLTPLKENDIRRGLKNAFLPGRFEMIREKPFIILDGAHNPDKVKALVRAIQSLFPKQKGIIVLAIKNDKNAKDMLRKLLPVCSQLILTKFRLTTDAGDTFSYTPTELSKIISRGFLAEIARGPLIKIKSNPIQAIQEAIKSARADDFILVTGSLYLVGEIRKFLIDL